MSNASSSLLTASMPDIATGIMRIAEHLAAGVCPSCGRHSIRVAWHRTQSFELSCGQCTFVFGNQASQSRAVGPVSGFLPQRLLFALAAIRRLKSAETEIRQTILQLVQEGAAIEPGTLGVEIREATRRPITDRLILDVLGPNVLSDLKQQAPARQIEEVRLVRPSRFDGRPRGVFTIDERFDDSY